MINLVIQSCILNLWNKSIICLVKHISFWFAQLLAISIFAGINIFVTVLKHTYCMENSCFCLVARGMLIHIMCTVTNIKEQYIYLHKVSGVHFPFMNTYKHEWNFFKLGLNWIDSKCCIMILCYNVM